MLGKDFTIPGVTRHVFESFSQGQSFSRSAGLSADSHHLQPRKAMLDQPLRLIPHRRLWRLIKSWVKLVEIKEAFDSP
jgi:hypothetical protein